MMQADKQSKVTGGAYFPGTATVKNEYCALPPDENGAVVIPNNWTRIHPGAFAQCSNLSYVIFESPASVVSIGIASFYQTGLTSLNVPDSVVEIGSFSFEKPTEDVE